MGCRRLRQVHLSNSLRRIECGLLARCRCLEEISIPDSVEVVCNGAFAECAACRSVRGGEKAIYGVKVFDRCDRLMEDPDMSFKISRLTQGAVSVC